MTRPRAAKLAPSGTLSPSTMIVITIANTPSLNASSLPLLNAFLRGSLIRRTSTL